MNLYVIFIILIVLVALSFQRLPLLVWGLVWMAAVAVAVKFGITPPVPGAMFKLYLALTALGFFAYVYADKERQENVSRQLFSFVTEAKYQNVLWGVVIALPILFATKIYLDTNVPIKAPSFGRTIHPAPPANISFKGKTIDLIRGKNPYRELETKEPEKFKEHLINGKRVYYQNCFFCHGDNLRGDGLYAHGYYPVPANFNSETTIPMLQEGYLFWRISKGGPGLPEESAPWVSSMPAWEKFLSEDEIWDVILFLYDHTGFKPREEEEHHE